MSLNLKVLTSSGSQLIFCWVQFLLALQREEVNLWTHGQLVRILVRRREKKQLWSHR
jgi:hypothetical protein